MILGGVPYYWKMIDPNKSLNSNIDNLFFANDAPMEVEYHILFKSMFRSPDKYESIVKNLAEKKKGITAKEISERTGISMSSRLTNMLDNLRMSGFISESQQPTKHKRGTVYQLADNFVWFYHDFLIKRKESSNFWNTHQHSGIITAWKGLAFERVCMQHIPQIQKALGVSGVYCKYYSWSAPQTDQFPGMQIDMVIDRADGIVNICEMKYSSGPYAISPGYMSELNLRRARYQQEVASKKGVHLTMVSAYGITRNAQSSEINSIITIDDLFEP